MGIKKDMGVIILILVVIVSLSVYAGYYWGHPKETTPEAQSCLMVVDDCGLVVNGTVKPLAEGVDGCCTEDMGLCAYKGRIAYI